MERGKLPSSCCVLPCYSSVHIFVWRRHRYDNVPPLLYKVILFNSVLSLCTTHSTNCFHVCKWSLQALLGWVLFSSSKLVILSIVVNPAPHNCSPLQWLQYSVHGWHSQTKLLLMMYIRMTVQSEVCRHNATICHQYIYSAGWKICSLFVSRVNDIPRQY